MTNPTAPYSILGYNTANTALATSYWTGTKYKQNEGQNNQYTTAENVAQWMAYSNPILPLNLNLNLMGTYERVVNGKLTTLYNRWQPSQNIDYETTVAPATGIENISITNVYMDGTTNGTTPITAASNGSLYLTLFGNNSNVSNISVDNIIISPDAAIANTNNTNLFGDTNFVIGAISAVAVTSVNVSVSNMTVNASKVTCLENVLGGAYYRINGTTINSAYPTTAGYLNDVRNLSAPYPIYGVQGNNEAGYIAGQLLYTMNANTVLLTNPGKYISGAKMYASVDIYVPQANVVNPALTFSGFGGTAIQGGTDFINSNTINEYVTVTVSAEDPSIYQNNFWVTIYNNQGNSGKWAWEKFSDGWRFNTTPGKIQ